MTQTFPNRKPIFCAGCGHFGVLSSIETALDRLGIPGHEALVLAGIGCSGTVQNHLPSYGYHSLHGRVVPSAIGAKLANPDLTVIAAGGDGDGYAIGGGHLIHAFRSNANVTYVVMNNETYGLTKGQPSPSAKVGFQDQKQLDPIITGLSLPGSTFLARGYTGWADQLSSLMDAAINHARAGQGFAFLEVISPCVTYNDNYQSWPSKLYNVDDDSSYESDDRGKAFQLALSLSEDGRVPAGLIYRGPAKLQEAQDSVPPSALDGVHFEEYANEYREIMDGFRG